MLLHPCMPVEAELLRPVVVLLPGLKMIAPHCDDALVEVVEAQQEESLSLEDCYGSYIVATR